MKLEPKVTEVLAYLATRPGEVVSRDDIEQAVWPNACFWPIARLFPRFKIVRYGAF